MGHSTSPEKGAGRLCWKFRITPDSIRLTLLMKKDKKDNKNNRHFQERLKGAYIGLTHPDGPTRHRAVWKSSRT